MADAQHYKNKEGGSKHDRTVASLGEEVHSVENSDEFDPFPGIVECVDENVDIDLKTSAPPESRWYHGRLNRRMAEERLRCSGQTGSYLIRESERKPGSYVLSFYGKSGLSHFRVTAMCGDYYIGGREFDTLADLIGYYTSWSDLLKEEKLQHPVCPPEPVNDQREVVAILPYSKMAETDELSFCKGEMFIVHNDMGDGWLWVTSKATGLSGIVYRELVQDIHSGSTTVESYGWYHDNITKDEARQRLLHAGPGSFLIRPSDTTPGDYTLFVHCSQCIQKFKVFQQGNQFLMGGRYFDSLSEIINRYSKEQIVEGQTLGVPVLRDNHPANSRDQMNGRSSNQSIYATMRQSSGSNFFLNRKDKVVINGYLHKKSQKNKKWKGMYFVLNDTEQQLYFFENQKRTKPKGLLELRDSSIYPVHDSFFGRPNCFQLVVSALNQESDTYYLCAESSDSAQRWVHELKQYCQNTVPKVSPHNTVSPLKQLRSLHICCKDAKKLSKHFTNPFCIVCLNDIKVCRTQAKVVTDPVIWGEEFILDDIPPDITFFSIKVHNKNRRSKDTEVATVKIQLGQLSSGKVWDEWQSLCLVNNPVRSDIGAVRISAKFNHEIIMPLKEYDALKELLVRAQDLETAQVLSEVYGNDRVHLAHALLQIFRHQRMEAVLLQKFTELEIDQEESAGTLFRGTSMATTLMDQYMKMTATGLLQNACQDTINKIMESKQNAEVNPAYCESQGDVETNGLYLCQLLDEAVTTIFKSTDSCPMVLRYICGCLQKKVAQRWPDNQLVKTRVVSGFIFLRLICPAILNPKSFNLITETPSNTACRTLKLVASSLIKLANLVEAKEHMMIINPFIQRNMERMKMFLNELSNVPDQPVTEESPATDLARHLATVHTICISNLPALKKRAVSQPLKRLVVVVEMLTSHKKHYMKDV